MGTTAFRYGIIIGVLITIAVMLAFLAPPITAEKMEGTLIDYRYYLRGEMQPPPDVVLVTVDDASVRRVGSWPWNTLALGRLFQGLSDAGARTVMSDILLLGGPGDERLGDTLERFGGAFLPVTFDMNRQFATMLDDLLPAHAIGSIPGGATMESERIMKAAGVYTPSRPLFSAAKGIGHINSVYDAAGVIRREPAVIDYEGRLYPPVSIMAAAHATGVPRSGVSLTDHGLVVGDTDIHLDRTGAFPINFYGGNNVFPSFSAADVMDGTIPTGVLRGKMIVLGATARGLASFRTTPYSRSMPAFEKHAHVAASIIENNLLMPAHPATNLLIIALTGIAASMLIAGRRWLVMALMTAVLGLVAFGAGQMLFAQGVVISLAFPLVAIGFIFLGNIAVLFLVQEQVIGRSRGMFPGAVEDAVMEGLAAAPDSDPTAPKQAVVTVLYAVIHDFSARAETAPPDEIMQQLNEYLDELSRTVGKWQGTLARGNSREVVAFWGAPVDDAAKEEAALRCALAMRAGITRLNDRWSGEGRSPFSVGIGIATGRALTGVMTTPGRKPWYTVIGRIADDAGLLAESCKKLSARILFTGQTLTPLRTQVEQGLLYRMEVRGIGRAPMPGFTEPVPLYEVHGLEHGEKSRIIEPERWEELTIKPKQT